MSTVASEPVLAELVDSDTARRMLSISRPTFSRLRQRKLLPAPDLVIGNRPRWRRSTILEFAGSGRVVKPSGPMPDDPADA
jgi:hypothetical protein